MSTVGIRDLATRIKGFNTKMFSSVFTFIPFYISIFNFISEFGELNSVYRGNLHEHMYPYRYMRRFVQLYSYTVIRL